ncbi:hypothetical protein CEV34_1370 [Brucella pseudogrignonensis]|uniref:Uncharacterized protein n=1 Tax=Brucella pseudogrignonensis TaxID=419475 RepID=A0A256GME0_9HYPH|nr:hypothetical protein CEV34_1370 [Brucella pseudogrignonensis]
MAPIKKDGRSSVFLSKRGSYRLYSLRKTNFFSDQRIVTSKD